MSTAVQWIVILLLVACVPAVYWRVMLGTKVSWWVCALSYAGVLVFFGGVSSVLSVLGFFGQAWIGFVVFLALLIHHRLLSKLNKRVKASTPTELGKVLNVGERWKSTMRVLALAFNVLLLTFALFLIFENGLPSSDKDLIAFVAIVVAPISAIVALLVGAPETVISLYFQRKALEERQRIRELSNKRDA